MDLTSEQKQLLKDLMKASANKGNLANAAIVFENDILLASAESWPVSDCNATAHSERMLVEIVGHLKHSDYTPGLTMITVVEPCVMCLSAASQAGYEEIAYIIPAKRYFMKIPWITDGITIDKQMLTQQFTHPIKLIQLILYEEEFCTAFEEAMSAFMR